MRTGDLAEVDEDGYWWYRGRADEVIISAGYRIGPEEVQETLVDHSAVEEAGVIGVDHETRGNIVKAYVTLAPGHEGDDDLREELTQFAKRELSKHEYPRELEFIDELPKTTSDKIIRRELKDRHEREHGEA
jgi:acetyl-CoA synthetase